jgi:hypothetical protein
MESQKPADQLTDDELFDEIREQVNLARNHTHGHNRKRTREIANEMNRRGWKGTHRETVENLCKPNQ